MKKHFKILSLILASATMFVACNKDDNGFVTLNAEIGNYLGGDNSKMYVDANYYTHWTTGDQVAINGNASSKKFTVDLPDNNTGKAKISVPTTASDTCYMAVYPASIASSYSSKSSSISISLPTLQEYSVVDGKQIINAPMFAYCAQGSTTLTFHNLCSLLKVTVSGRSDEDIIMQSITVTSNNKGLSGSGTINSPKSASPYLTMSSANKSVSLVFTGSTETISQNASGKSYYIVIPPFISNTDITITTEAIGSNEMKKIVSKSSVTLAANLIVSCPTIDMSDATVIFYGDGTESSPFLINDIADLNTLKDRVDAGFDYKGKIFKLMDNIPCGSWNGIGKTSSYLFKGIFDGNNKTITYTLTSSGSYCGLFKYIGPATVKKLKVHCTINNAGAGDYAGYCGGIAGYSYGTTFEDDTIITGSSISGSGRYYGGITGSTTTPSVTITRCHSCANIESTRTNDQLYIGGIAGYVQPSGSRVESCSASGDIIGSDGDIIGGIVGGLNSDCTVDNCTFTGTVKGKDGATKIGTFVGDNKGTVTNCPPAK